MADAQLADVKIRLLESGVGSPPDGASPSASDAPSPGAVSNFTRTISRFSQRGRQGSSHLVSRRGSGSVSESEVPASEVAFRIQVGVGDGRQGQTDGQEASMMIDVHHEAVSGAVQDAVQNAVDQVVQDAVHGAVHGAVQRVLDNPDLMRFDVRTNLFTLVAITGVVLYWRGVWTLWDYLFGFSLYSECGAVGVGLAIMLAFRIAHVPLLDGLPSG